MERLKQMLRRIDPGFLVVLAIALLAVWPFISRSSLPMETDAELHIFRLHELGLLIRGGEFYPRWAPNFYHGYGYPIFNYYAPLSYYVALPLELLPWFDAVAAVKAVFVLGLLAAALGMYGFVRDNWGRGAGYVAAAVYVYAPYVQYVDPHARGVLAESFSLGVFALALWALDRLRKGGGARVWVTAVLLVAAVVLAHNLMALLFGALLAAWVVWHGLIAYLGRSGGVGYGRIPLLVAALALGVGVAAFFWLPVLAERNAVNLNTLVGAGNNYDFRTHFLSVRTLLSFTQRLDWGASEPAFLFNLGVAQWTLAGLGVVMLAARRVRDGAHLAFFALSLALLVWLMLPVSIFVWEATPILPFFQFPWRLLGPAAAMCAVLAGAGSEALLRGRAWVWGTAVFVLFPLLLGLPLTQPAPWGDFGEVNTLRMSLIENTGRWLGTTSTADYVPTTVDTVPQRKGSVVSAIAEGRPMDRINYATLPEGTAVQPIYLRPLHTQYEIDAPESFLFRLFLFDFPGWQVTVDGAPVETELGRPEGFLVIPVSAGRHVVDVYFGSTPARHVAWVITAVSLLLTGVVALMLRRGRWVLAGYERQLPRQLPQPLTRMDGWVLGGVLLVTAVTILILQPLNWLHFNSTGYTAEPARTPVFADFGEQIALIGYTAGAETAQPGDVVRVELYWKAQNELDINYQVFLHLLTPDGVLVTQSHKLNPGEFPTRRWPTDQYVRDEHYLQIPADLPPGAYTVAAGLWVQDEGWRLPLLDENGVQVGDNRPLFNLQVGETE